MFIYTAKITKKKLIICVLACAAAICLIVVLAGRYSSSRTVFGAPAASGGINSNEKRIAFINSYGWEVNPEPVEVIEVRIPDSFDSVYAEYNELQKSQGFDLSRFTGRRAKRYTYIITNYPLEEKDIRLNLLIYNDNRVIAGDILSPAISGFMRGLVKE